MGHSQTSGYALFDQRTKLGEPPWSGAALEAWEKAHGHDARLKCYPEFGCQVLEAARERLRDSASWLLRCHDDMIAGHSVRNLDEAWEGLRHALLDLEES